MNVTAFQKAIGANSKSYSSFMDQKGPYKGPNSNVYPNVFALFKARELNGIKPLKRKKSKKKTQKKHSAYAVLHSKGSQSNSSPSTTTTKSTKIIHAYLTLPSVTQAGILRETAKTYGPEKKYEVKSWMNFWGRGGQGRGIRARFIMGVVFSLRRFGLEMGRGRRKRGWRWRKFMMGGSLRIERRAWC
jgi:hypothetical protein